MFFMSPNFLLFLKLRRLHLWYFFYFLFSRFRICIFRTWAKYALSAGTGSKQRIYHFDIYQGDDHHDDDDDDDEDDDNEKDNERADKKRRKGHKKDNDDNDDEMKERERR